MTLIFHNKTVHTVRMDMNLIQQLINACKLTVLNQILIKFKIQQNAITAHLDA